jgi:predicted acylesterase/phospholipase RssA
VTTPGAITPATVPAAVDPTATIGSGPAIWYDSKPPRSHLKVGQITHLALEGGGGKGFAFVGAIKALEEIGVLGYETDSYGQRKLECKVKGLAGASAGAITAMLLSAGMNSSEIHGWMTSTEPPPAGAGFAQFFDSAEPRQNWQGQPIPSTDHEIDLAEKTQTKLSLLRIGLVPFADRMAVLEHKPPPEGDDMVTKLATVLLEVIKGIGPLPVTSLSDHLAQRLAWLERDMGVFSGAYAYETFQTMIQSRYKGQQPPSGPIGFEAFEQHFGVQLVVTGSNLSTGKTVWFGSKTREVEVAAAVRASMSLPFIFKPVWLESNDMAIKGIYVDGGVWNNTPADAFDTDRDNPTTLVLRLDIDTTAPVFLFTQFAARYLGLTAGGSGETQFDLERAFQAIELDTKGLDTVDFTPPAPVRDAAINNAYCSTYEYFEISPPTKTPKF